MCPPPKWCRCLASGPQSRTEHIQGPMPPSPVSRSPPSTFLCLAHPPTWVSKPTLTLWKTELGLTSLFTFICRGLTWPWPFLLRSPRWTAQCSTRASWGTLPSTQGRPPTEGPLQPEACARAPAHLIRSGIQSSLQKWNSWNSDSNAVTARR